MKFSAFHGSCGKVVEKRGWASSKTIFLDPLNYKRIENAGGGGQAFVYFLFSRFFVSVRLRLLEKQGNRELLVGKSRCLLSKELQIARRKLSKVNSAKT